LDRPDPVPLLDEAINIVAGLGQWVIPALVDKLDAGGLKAQMAMAQVLGRMGDVAIRPLMTRYQAMAEPARRAFILYALGTAITNGIARTWSARKPRKPSAMF